MDDFKLRPYDGIAITGLLILPPLFTTGLSELVEQNNTAVWITLLVSFAVMLCLFLTIACLIKRYEGRNLIEITSAVMGGPIGGLYAVILSAYFCFFTGAQIREGAEILKLYGLDLTPLCVIAGLILLAAVVMNLLGGWPIVKSAGFFFVIIALGIVFIALLGLNRYNPDNLVPLLGNGLPAAARNGLFAASLFDSVIVLFLFAPAFSHSSKLKKSGALALAVTAGAFILLSVCFIMMFSPSIASKMMSGFIEMGKSVYYNHFFYRFEAPLLLLLIFSSVVGASIGLLVARKSLACAFRRPSSRVMTVICAVPAAIAVFLPVNILDLTQQYFPVIRRYSVFFMAGFPLLVLLVSSIKGIYKHEND